MRISQFCGFVSTNGAKWLIILQLFGHFDSKISKQLNSWPFDKFFCYLYLFDFVPNQRTFLFIVLRVFFTEYKGFELEAKSLENGQKMDKMKCNKTENFSVYKH